MSGAGAREGDGALRNSIVRGGPIPRLAAAVDVSYSNVEVDGILEAASKTRDYKQFKEKMKQLHAVLNTDLPYLFLWSLDIYSGISKRVRNVFIQPYYYFTFFREWELTP